MAREYKFSVKLYMAVLWVGCDTKDRAPGSSHFTKSATGKWDADTPEECDHGGKSFASLPEARV
jgi:hypothetical protein